MPAKKKVPSPSRLLDVSEDAWAEAVRREQNVRRLANTDTCSKAEVQAAAKDLGLSASQIYRMIAKFRVAPVTASLVVTKPGPEKGSRRLPGPVELLIDGAIERVFKAREQPTLEKLRRDLCGGVAARRA